MQLLAEHIGDLPWVGEIRGLGLLIGIEYVQSKEGRERIPADAEVGRSLWEAMWNRGFLLRTLHHGSALVGDCTNFVPALTITEEQLGDGIACLGKVIRALGPTWV